MKKIIPSIFVVIFLIPAVIIGVYGIMSDERPQKNETFASYAERIACEAVSLSEDIKDIAPRLLYTLYPSQRDGIFITKNYLLEDVKPGDFSAENSRTVKAFSEETGIPSYFAIVPTSIAIKQEELPKRAVIFNQKKLIEECYKMAGGLVKGVDTYSELFSVRDQYLYYKTEPLNTSLGGYYIYHAVLKAMRENPMEINEFSVFHRENKMLGSLAKRVSLGGIDGDLASIYEHESSRNYSVVHKNKGEIKKYYGLCSKGYYEDGFVTMNGGESPVIEIDSVGGRFDSLLLVGDKNALSVLPFLAVDFNHVTYINPQQADLGEISSSADNDFDRVVFCFDASNITKDIGLDRLFSVIEGQ